MYVSEFQKLAELFVSTIVYGTGWGHIAAFVSFWGGGKCGAGMVQFWRIHYDFFFLPVYGKSKGEAGIKEEILYLREGKRKRKLEEDLSLRAKVLRQLIRMATSEKLLGPRIQDGTLRKNVVEPAWHCPKGYSLLKMKDKTARLELLTPPEIGSEMVVLQLHGGGYIGEMTNVYRNFAKEYSDMRGGMRVCSVDYRVAPRHPYPAALEDACLGYQFLRKLGYLPEQMIVVGDSAGGGLALALCAYLRDRKMELPRGLVLMSPWTDLTASGDSYRENYEKDPFFGNTRESMIYRGEYPGKENPENPYISPKFADYTGFPRMLFQVGSIEMLLSDTTDVAEKAREAGCQVEVTVYEGMFHEFQQALDRMPESKAAWEEVRAFVQNL